MKITFRIEFGNQLIFNKLMEKLGLCEIYREVFSYDTGDIALKTQVLLITYESENFDTSIFIKIPIYDTDIFNYYSINFPNGASFKDDDDFRSKINEYIIG